MDRPDSHNVSEKHIKDIRALSFTELLDFHDSLPDALSVPARLRHILLANYKVFPFVTVGDYLDAGKAATTKLMRIQNFGKKTERDLSNLVYEVMNADTANIAFGHQCRNKCAKLHKALPEVHYDGFQNDAEISF